MGILKELCKLLVTQPKENKPAPSPPYMQVNLGGMTLYRCCHQPDIADYQRFGYTTCWNCKTKVYAATPSKRAELWNETIRVTKGYQ